MRRCAIALVHHPVVDAQSAVVTTAVTNLDVHDLARSARTFGCSDYFVVHPIAAQRELVGRICSHWTEGPGGRRIPDRAAALGLVRIVSSLEDVYAAFGGRGAVETWATAARDLGPTLAFREARVRLADASANPVLVVFGTGWGLAPAVLDGADAILEPIAAAHGDYNHLSVRAACAIALDRLLGRR
ncbi:MAG: RNA methyltransferase [Polyangiaceae bacterium]|nr:RNA methyltransferase [Polyangiaceae bacterium]